MADTYDNQDDDMDLNDDGSADVELPEDISDVTELPDGSAVVSRFGAPTRKYLRVHGAVAGWPNYWIRAAYLTRQEANLADFATAGPAPLDADLKALFLAAVRGNAASVFLAGGAVRSALAARVR